MTYLLDIDDSSYRKAEFYPADLVAFARQAKIDYAPPGLPPTAPNELCMKAEDACPKSGEWKTLDIPSVTKFYEEVQRILS